MSEFHFYNRKVGVDNEKEQFTGTVHECHDRCGGDPLELWQMLE